MSYKIGSRRAQDITSGEFDDARVKASSVVQHEEELEAVLDLGDLQPSNVVMGNFTIQCDQDPSDDKDLGRKGYIDSEVSGEKSRAETAEAALQTAIDDEKSRAETAEAANAAAVETEKSRAETAESANASAIGVEKARVDAILDSADADKDSFAEIVTLINSVDLTNDNALASAITSLNTDIAAVQSDVDQNESDCDAGLSSASTDRAAIRSEFASADATEKARAEAAEAANASAISAEETRALAAEGVNAAAVATEKTRAEAAEGVLTTDLASLTSTVASNKTASESADTSATTDRGSIRSEFAAADTALESSLQSNIDTEKARLDVLEGDSSTPGSVAKAIADLVDGADAALDTLKELGEALGDDADFAATITSSVASVQSALDTFIARTDNPHSVTAVQLGVEKGVDVQEYDAQLDSITNLYHPGEKKQVISWYTYQGGQTPTPNYEEFGVFTNAPIKEGINTNYLSGSSGSIYSFTYKYELLRTDGISSGVGTYELTLPQIQDADEGRMMVLKVDGMQDAGSNPVAIKFVADAADSIDGSADFTLDDSYQALSLVASKSFGWQIV